MKNIRRTLALIGAVLLALMYVSTFVFALIDHSASQGLLKASIACTFFIPVMIYAIALVYKVTRSDNDKKDN